MHDPRSYGDQRGSAVVAALADIAEAHGATPAAVAMAWALAQPGVTATVVSARTPDQVVQLGAAVVLDLRPDELERLSDVSAPAPRSASAS
jgi:aryl-alcohol dehydrogenase-like predicted oxidoreductase